MQRDEILRRMRRIAGDFAPLIPGIRLEVVSPEGFRARLRGKPLLPGEEPPPSDPPPDPVKALPSSRTIILEMEGLQDIVNKEDKRLSRPLVEGMILREVIYLVTTPRSGIGVRPGLMPGHGIITRFFRAPKPLRDLLRFFSHLE